LSGLDYPRERFEIIVVNDGGGSIDDAVAPFLGQMNVTRVTQKNAGPASARNTGVARARGRYTAFTDDDCRPDRDWLKELELHLAADESILVGGRIINALEDNDCSAASQLLVTYLYAYYNADRELALFFTSNNMAMAREAFLSFGGFDARYMRAAAEDRELCDRWTHSGRRMVYAETALIRHSHRLTFGSFWRQHFQYGQGALQYRKARAQRDGGPVRVEPLRFYAGLLRYPWAAGVRRPLRIAALLFIAQTANAMGFLREKIRSGRTPVAVPES
jgi:cellulose synthase/poly-beta-1,6-N-acetylglucosamine synthase-like glycosyltransferase